MTPEMIAILAVGASLVGVGVALGGLVWQSHRALRADLGGRMDRMEGVMKEQGGRMDRIEGVMKEQGERIARIEGMLHLHLGRNADIAVPAAPTE